MTEGQEKSTPQHEEIFIELPPKLRAALGEEAALKLVKSMIATFDVVLQSQGFDIVRVEEVRSVAGGEPQEPDSVKSGLKYIADSPPKEHGGFHPQTVEIAKQALARIEQLVAGGEPEQWISVETPPEMDGVTYLVYRIEHKTGIRFVDIMTAQGQAAWRNRSKGLPSGVTHWRPLPAPPQGKEQK